MWLTSNDEEREMFDTLKIDGEFSHFKLGNGGKMKVEGIGSVRMKLHGGAIRTFLNVRFVPFVDLKFWT